MVEKLNKLNIHIIHIGSVMASVLPSGRSWLSSMRVKPKNIKLVFTAFPLNTEHYGIRTKTGWLGKRITSPS
jgi:hypothetical protein